MTEWKLQRGTQMEHPKEVDRISSPTTVYLRRNIQQVAIPVSEGSEETIMEWQYEEKEMSVEEYNNMLLMQQIITENTQGIVESVTEFQKEAVIDEYTEQLIEEGLI